MKSCDFSPVSHRKTSPRAAFLRLRSMFHQLHSVQGVQNRGQQLPISKEEERGNNHATVAPGHDLDVQTRWIVEWLAINRSLPPIDPFANSWQAIQLLKLHARSG